MRTRVVDSYLELGYNGIGYLRTKEGLIKIHRDADGEQVKGWTDDLYNKEEERQEFQKKRRWV